MGNGGTIYLCIEDHNCHVDQMTFLARAALSRLEHQRRLKCLQGAQEDLHAIRATAWTRTNRGRASPQPTSPPFPRFEIDQHSRIDSSPLGRELSLFLWDISSGRKVSANCPTSFAWIPFRAPSSSPAPSGRNCWATGSSPWAGQAFSSGPRYKPKWLASKANIV